MSDVERIVNANNERVRWAEEYETGGRIATATMGPRNDMENGLPRACGPRNDKHVRKAYRETALGCAMFTGEASAFVGIGLYTGRWLTVAVGLVVAVLFLCFGLWSERLAEEDDA